MGSSLPGGARSRGFTLIELLATLGITMTLLGVLMPALRAAREMANRIECASNLHQMGLGIQVFASSNDEQLPSTVFSRGASRPDQMMSANLIQSDPIPSGIDLGEIFNEGGAPAWDGLGRLAGTFNYVSARNLYCPSHHGDHSWERYTEAWEGGAPQKITINYHYCGHIDPIRGTMRRLYADPRAALVADGMQDASDVNHTCGCSMLHADGSTGWWYDSDAELLVPRANSVVGGDVLRDWYAQMWAKLASQ